MTDNSDTSQSLHLGEDGFLDELRQNGHGPATIRRYETAIAEFLAVVAGHQADLIGGFLDRGPVHDYDAELRSSGLAMTTVADRLNRVRSFLDWVTFHGEPEAASVAKWLHLEWTVLHLFRPGPGPEPDPPLLEPTPSTSRNAIVRDVEHLLNLRLGVRMDRLWGRESEHAIRVDRWESPYRRLQELHAAQDFGVRIQGYRRDGVRRVVRRLGGEPAEEGDNLTIIDEPEPAPEAPPSAPGAPEAARAINVERETTAAFPPEVVAGSKRRLTVAIGSALGPAPAKGLIQFGVQADQTTVEISVQIYAPGLQVVRPRFGAGQSPVTRVTLDLTRPEARVECRFELLALPTEIPRAARVRVLFTYRDMPIGSLVIETRVMPASAGRRRLPASVTNAFATIPGQPPRPADVTLMVFARGDDNFDLRGISARYTGRELGAVPIGPSAWVYTQTLFDQFREAAALDDPLKQTRLEGLGLQLWKRMPQGFHDFFEEEMSDRDISVMVVSEEPVIPWELIKPPDGPDGPRAFFGLQFRMARWTSRAVPNPLVVTDFAAVAPAYANGSLTETAKEVEDLRKEYGARILGDTYKAVSDCLSSTGLRLWHFAGHGSFAGQDPNTSTIRLSDGSLYPSDIDSLRKNKWPGPFVFLNACQAGGQRFTFTGIGGWAETFCDLGSVGFVGPYWEVDDVVAHEAALRFYAALESGATVGAAIREVRQGYDEPGPYQGHPTWLAYSLHCQPNVEVSFEKGGVSS